MKKCKAENCNEEINENRIYCSVSCRTRTTNKLYKDYNKVSKTIQDKHKQKYIVKFCKNCNSELTYEQRLNKFCNHSCAAKYTNKHRTVVYSEEGIARLRLAAQKLRKHPKRSCLFCKEWISGKNRKYCNVQCRKAHLRQNTEEKRRYRLDCAFKFLLREYPDEFDFNLIKIHGWYKAKNRGNNLNGVSRDHILSVMDGFRLGVPPEIMRHPANCRLLLHNDNVSKGKKSFITYQELLDKIKKWNEKYEENL